MSSYSVIQLTFVILCIVHTGKTIEIQKKLLELEYHHVQPDDDFLQSFSRVVGSKWPYLASLLSLSSGEIKEVRKGMGEGLTSESHALLMLRKWVSREDATYGQLYKKIKPVSLFQLCK